MSMNHLERAVLAKQLRIDPEPTDRDGNVSERIRIKVRCIAAHQVCAGTVFTHGESEYDIYRAHLASIESMAEMATEGELAQVQRDLDHHTSMMTAGEAPRDRPYAPSWSASFRRVLNRDPLPFTSVEIVAKQAAKKRAAG